MAPFGGGWQTTPAAAHLVRATSSMPTRRLDDRIRYLSAKLKSAADDEVEEILQELLSAIHEKLDRLRTRAASRFLAARPLHERRIAPP